MQLPLGAIPLWNNKKDLTGPFDIIGDVHGCCDELESLLSDLGYERKTLAPEDEFRAICISVTLMAVELYSSGIW